MTKEKGTHGDKQEMYMDKSQQAPRWNERQTRSSASREPNMQRSWWDVEDKAEAREGKKTIREQKTYKNETGELNQRITQTNQLEGPRGRVEQRDATKGQAGNTQRKREMEQTKK